MGPLLACILFTLMAITVETKQTVTVRGKQKLILESVETNCDHNFVEYFHKVPDKEMHVFRVVKRAPSFTINLIMRAMKSQRIMYKIANLDGCQFLNNPIMNKVLEGTYRTLVVNNSFFTCPIVPKVYYLKNVDKAFVVPPIHPAGHYQLSMSLHMPLSTTPFVMEILWKYNVIHLKK